MTSQKLSQTIEMRFWKSLLPLIEEKGPIVKAKRWFYKVIHSKPGFLVVLVFIWSAVGFFAGLLIGRALGLFPLP